ncbi:MAG: alpha/beta hydrolase, partial [Gammaproteobacteria bacterium]|nr:alpha/beta hydrolase [Gammaproteobacteria bacterium]NNL49990.1 alpha/beta hydrolase [Woeseiaceae bacterium]
MPKQHRTVVNDAEIAWFEWGRPGEPLILLSHATGLHARCWDAVVAHLNGYHVIATDHRGHGQSSKTPPYVWDQFGADLIALIVALDLSDINGVGHSMGGHCMVQAAAREPARFRQLTLFDPVIMEPSVYAMPRRKEGMQHPVAKRRNAWESPQQMVDQFSGRAPFSRWHPDVLRDYCQHGLLRDGEAYKLACPPDVEAGIYTASLDMKILDYIPMVPVPVTVIRAEARGLEAAVKDFSASPTWPELADQFARGEDKY